MASLIDTLIDVLGQEDAEYKKLLELSNNKTKAIVGADIERLQDILVQEQARIDAINKLEQQRMENVDDICNVLNLRRTDIKLEDILEVLKKQPKEHDALAAVNAQLKKTLNELSYNAQDTLVVGDMPFDILMGKNAGVYTCGVTYGVSGKNSLLEAGADWVIDDISELLDIV